MRASLGRGRPGSGMGLTAPRTLLPTTSCAPSGAQSNVVTPSGIDVNAVGSPPSSDSAYTCASRRATLALHDAEKAEASSVRRPPRRRVAPPARHRSWRTAFCRHDPDRRGVRVALAVDRDADKRHGLAVWRDLRVGGPDKVEQVGLADGAASLRVRSSRGEQDNDEGTQGACRHGPLSPCLVHGARCTAVPCASCRVPRAMCLGAPR